MSADALKGKKLGGTNIKEDLFEKNKIFYTMFEPRLQYAWDNGIAIGAYLKGLKEGKILASVCTQCNRIMVPTRTFCELCWRTTDRTVEVKDTGTIQTFSIARINWDASRLKSGETPTIPAVISLDGASDKMGIMHLIGGVKPEAVKIGMKVKAVWKQAKDRTGTITDIEYFKPVK
ncbi:MAG: Zn-ribbon domain-containing OB-fold protein [Desulfomonilia bacterium]|nr:Zn-ribbon domain-containing OB-fold protein [Desulfomonilia bacterium]